MNNFVDFDLIEFYVNQVLVEETCPGDCLNEMRLQVGDTEYRDYRDAFEVILAERREDFYEVA